MNGQDLAGDAPARGLKARIKRAVGPAGLFLRGFLEQPKMVASVIPSSAYTIRKMLAPVDWEKCKVFVEYGPGVGTFCRPVLDRLSRDATLISIDTNPLFIKHLQREIRDSRFHAVHGSAEDVEAIVASLGHDGADYVVSGIPFSVLPGEVGPNIAAATYRVLKPGGAFMTYQFTVTARDLTVQNFERVDTGFTWWNVPPCILAWGWKQPG